MQVPSNFFTPAEMFDTHVSILPVERRRLDPKTEAIVKGLCQPARGLYIVDGELDTIYDETITEFTLTCMVKSEEGLGLLMQVVSAAKEAYEDADIISNAEQGPVRMEVYWNGPEDNDPAWQVRVELGRPKQHAKRLRILEAVISGLVATGV